ncbi:MAG: NAD(P)/FAD-dependent oxidoreductase [Prolixibacteraceae bacterium]
MAEKTNTDTLIVGGGLAGSVLAYQLLRRGIDCVVIDGSMHKASAVAAGMYNPMVFRRLVKSWMVDELLPYFNQFYSQLEKELSISFFHPMSFYKLMGEQEVKFWVERAKMQETKPYLNPEIQFPYGFEAIHHPFGMAQVFEAGWVNLGKMLGQLHQQFKEKGALINEAFNYSELNLLQDGVNYKNWQAKRIVFCEGSYASYNPMFSYIPFKPTKGEVITVFCKGLQLETIINKNGFILPLGNDVYKVGATYEWKDLTAEPTASGKNQLEEKLRTMLKLPYEIIKHEAGIRPTINDRRPVLGAHPVHKNVFIFNGLGTKGVMLAPYFSNQLMEHIFSGGALHPEVNVGRFKLVAD